MFLRMYFIFIEFRFVILAADASAARSILVFKHDQDKVIQKYRLFFLSCFLLFFDFNIFVYSRKFSIQYTFQIVTLDSHKLLVGAGTAADCVNFNEFIGKNMKLYELNNDIQLSTKAAANYIRGEVERL